MIYGKHLFGINIIIYENFNFQKTTFTVLVMHNNAPFVRSNANHLPSNNNYTYTINNPKNYSPYKSIAQTAYTWGGWANEKYPSFKVKDEKEFRPGFNDVSAPAPSNFY